MSKSPDSISGLIDEFKTIVNFADEIGCGYEAARQMRLRGRISAKHWSSVISAAERRGIEGVSYEWLAGQVATTSEPAA